MAVKTITIDLEAYEALRRHKRDGQSFSQVIKQHFGGRKTAASLAGALTVVTFEESTVDAVEVAVESRRTDTARAVDL
jgi:predicted CopG family antitoxin